MKIGAKQIALFTLVAVLLVVGYKQEELAALWKGKEQVVTTPTPDHKDTEAAEDAFVSTRLPFDNNRLERDRGRAKIKEVYQAITEDMNASAETVEEAYDNIMVLAQQAEQESKVESLIREKGFSDAYACFSDLGEMDVLIKTETLTEMQVTQIADIIVRYTGLDYSVIHVRKVA